MLERGLVGYWSPWLGATGFRLLDRTRYANHGTLTNMDPPTDWVGANIFGRSGRVLDFDGVDDRCAVSSFRMAALNDVTNSVAFWFRPTATGNTTRIFGAGEFGNNFAMRFNFQNLEFTFGGTAILSVTMLNATYSNRWTHVVGVADSSGARIFFDGVQVGTRSDTVSLTKTNGLGIGYRFGTNTDHFSGRIADLSLHSRTLTPAEVRTLYRLGPGWFGQREPRRRYAVAQAAGFKAYWARRQTQIIGGGF